MSRNTKLSRLNSKIYTRTDSGYSSSSSETFKRRDSRLSSSSSDTFRRTDSRLSSTSSESSQIRCPCQVGAQSCIHDNIGFFTFFYHTATRGI